VGRHKKEPDVYIECLKCGLKHFRNDRKKAVPKEGAERKGTLSVLVCPKCGSQKYVLLM
jgi:hypothetical protein